MLARTVAEAMTKDVVRARAHAWERDVGACFFRILFCNSARTHVPSSLGRRCGAQVTVAPGATLQDAAQLMLRKKARRQPSAPTCYVSPLVGAADIDPRGTDPSR